MKTITPLKVFVAVLALAGLLFACLVAILLINSIQRSVTPEPQVESSLAEKSNCDFVSQLISPSLAAEMQSAADRYVIDQVGESDFDRFYRCDFVGFSYVSPAEGTPYFDYIYSQYIDANVMLPIVAYSMIIDENDLEPEKVDVDPNYRYDNYTYLGEEPVDVFRSGSTYTIGRNSLQVVFVGPGIEPNLSAVKFPTSDKFKVVRLNSEEAYAAAEEAYFDGVSPYLKYEQQPFVPLFSGYGAELEWDAIRGKFHWTIFLEFDEQVERYWEYHIWADGSGLRNTSV